MKTNNDFHDVDAQASIDFSDIEERLVYGAYDNIVFDVELLKQLYLKRPEYDIINNRMLGDISAGIYNLKDGFFLFNDLSMAGGVDNQNEFIGISVDDYVSDISGIRTPFPCYASNDVIVNGKNRYKILYYCITLAELIIANKFLFSAYIKQSNFPKGMYVGLANNFAHYIISKN